MAARKTHKFLSDEHRLKIQTTQLIKRLTSFVNSEIELSPAQVTAALGLLKKSLPDLQAQASGSNSDGSLKEQIQMISLINAAPPNSKD